MMSVSLRQSIIHRTAGCFWLAVGLTAMVLGKAIKKPGFASNQDPGPQFFPILLGMALFFGGAALLIKSFFSAQTVPNPPESLAKNSSLFGFIGGFFVYLLLMPWIGFSISSVAFIFSMIWLQGTRWIAALPIAVLIVVGIQLLFGNLFHVQLPAGVFGIPGMPH